MHRVGKFLIEHRLWMWGLVILLSVPPALGLSGKRIYEGKRDHWVSEGDWDQYGEIQESFEFSGFPCVLVVTSDDFFIPDRIAKLREMVSRLESNNDVFQVICFGRLPKLTWTGFQPLLPEEATTETALKQARDDLLQHPLVVNQLLSKDGRTLLIPLDMGWNTDSVIRVSATIREMLEGSGMQGQLTGAAVLWATNEIAQEEDHERILLTAICVVVVLALIIFRRPSAILIACSGPAVGVLWAEGWLQLLGLHRNELAEIILPVMVLMIGFTDGVHLVVDMRQRRASGLDPKKAVAETFGCVGTACLLTSITTAIGFGSLMIADSEMIRGFGLSSAIGVLVTFVAVVLVIPLLGCSRFGRGIHFRLEHDLVGRNIERLSGLMNPIMNRAPLFAFGGVLLTVLFIAGSLRLRPDDRLAHRVPNNSDAYQALLHCDRTLGGIRFMQVLIKWPAETATSDVSTTIKEIEDALRHEELISEPVSIRTCLATLPGPDMPQKLQLGLPFIPEEYRRQFWDAGARRTQIVVRLKDLGMAVYQPSIDRVQQTIDELLRQNPGFEIALTGEALIDSQIVGRNARELLHSLMLAAAVIFVVIAVAFRSIRFGIISIIPNVLPLAATAALRASIDVSLDIASACSFAICLGIAVDDTIHFLTRFRNERSAGHDVRTAIRRTFVTVGTALVMTTVVLISGFASVMTSQLPTHFLFATMACTTIGFALLADLFILPALLCCFAGE